MAAEQGDFLDESRGLGPSVYPLGHPLNLKGTGEPNVVEPGEGAADEEPAETKKPAGKKTDKTGDE